jgi:hypothetical protein
MPPTPRRQPFTPVLAALALAACGDAAPTNTATLYWSQPDTVIIGLGRPSDVKAQSRDRVWVADRESGLILGLAPADSEYVSIGMADREPTQVQLPGKLAVASDIGLSAYDIQTGSVDLFTFGGDYIRSFTPGFVPAVMSFSKAPLGYTFGIAAIDSAATREAREARAATSDSAAADSDTVVVRRAFVIRTDLQGNARDTLLSPTRGPESLRGTTADEGETLMAPSASGMWVWSRLVPDSVYDITPKGTRRLYQQLAGQPLGMFADPVREMLWLVLPASEGIRLAAFDTRAEVAETPEAYLGDRIIDEPSFRPAAIFDGVVMGFRGIGGGAIAMSAYDLHTEAFNRAP